MKYVKGMIASTNVPAFVEYLQSLGYATKPGSSVYELAQVLVEGRWLAISTNSKQIVGLPHEIACYVPLFYALRPLSVEPVAGITDTQRLDFMLCKHRNVVVENTCDGHHKLYVEEGFMGDKSYPWIRVKNSGDIKWASPEAASLKRQAIDLAISETKV